MIQGATPGSVPIFVCRKSWLCCRLANIFNLQNKSFCIYFYQGNLTFKNIINLVSFIITLVEYLVINSYSVTVLESFRKETTDRAKKHPFLEVFNSLTFILGNPPNLHGLPSWKKVWWRYHFDSLNFFFYHISKGKRAMQLLLTCIALSITWRLFTVHDSDPPFKALLVVVLKVG